MLRTEVQTVGESPSVTPVLEPFRNDRLPSLFLRFRNALVNERRGGLKILRANVVGPFDALDAES